MRILLVSANTERINMPALTLGLACVAAATKKAGHDVAMVDLMVEGNTQSVFKEAIEEGTISPYDPLLFPRFYLAKGLETWLSNTLRDWASTRPHWRIQDDH